MLFTGKLLFTGISHTGTLRYWCHPPRCVMCSLDRVFIEDCTKSLELPIKWTLCSSTHPANYKEYPSYKKLQLSSNKKHSFRSNSKDKKTFPMVPTKKVLETHTHNMMKTYVEVTSDENLLPETVPTMLLNLNSITIPLISLLSSILNT